jgi:hypothetical protein
VTDNRLALPLALNRHVVSLELAEPSSARKYRMRRHVPTSAEPDVVPPVPAVPTVPIDPRGAPSLPLSQAAASTIRINTGNQRRIEIGNRN